MIKFFRKIRRGFLSENRVSKYLLYAIGEIILVVIGILIALQINNWNEQSKINASIRQHLTILAQNLREDQRQLKELVQTMSKNVDYADSTMRQIRTLNPVDKQLKKYLVKLILEYQFLPNTNSIETITQSNEIPYLKQGLQTAILDYYALIESTQERERISNNQIQGKYEAHLNNHYPEIFQKDNEWDFIQDFYRNDPRPVVAIDSTKFLHDRQLEALLVSRYFQCTRLQEFYQELLASSAGILTRLALESETIEAE